MRQRIITAVFFVIAVIGGVFGGPLPLFLLVTAIALGCLWELQGLLMPGERTFRRYAGAAAGYLPVLIFGGCLIWPGAQGDHFTAAALTLGAAAGAMLLLLGAELFLESETPFQNIGAVLTGALYVGLPLALLLSIATPGGVYNPYRVFGLLWLVWTNDTMAYFTGTWFGKNKLYERISPKKTWEGTIGGVLGTLLMAWVLSQYFSDYSASAWLALGAIASAIGTVGDLVESMLKRHAGVKDSGDLLPGHGGMLDRFDSFIFMLPFAWLAIWWLERVG